MWLLKMLSIFFVYDVLNNNTIITKGKAQDGDLGIY